MQLQRVFLMNLMICTFSTFCATTYAFLNGQRKFENMSVDVALSTYRNFFPIEVPLVERAPNMYLI